MGDLLMSASSHIKTVCAWLGALFFAAVAINGSAQQPPLGIAPVTLGDKPYVFDTAEQHQIRVTVIARGLPHPFALAFLPNGDALISERGAKLRIVHQATGASPGPKLDPAAVAGVPETLAFRGSGLVDLALHPRFNENGFVYFTFNKAGAQAPDPKQQQASITLVRGRFDGKVLTDLKELFVGDLRVGTSGSRIAFGQDGFIYISTGSPFSAQAQDLGTVYGKVLRLRDDGTVPRDNPFADRAGARPEIYSLGHRDQLGLTIQPATGKVVAAEHGPNGGDEINVILSGRNYGWPKVTFGRDYQGPMLSDSPVAPGIEPPIVVWLPSIAPSGLVFYSGDRFPAWKGNLFTGSARRGEIPRTGGLERVVFNDRLEELRRETLLTELHQRIRDVRQGPDGLLYVLTDEDDGALLRIEPAP
jgi:glucose/arabinose dehydrogenase